MLELCTSFVSSQVFWSIITVGIAYLLIKSLLIPKIQSTLRNRDVYIDDNINEAKLLSDKAKLVTKEYDDNIAKLKKIAYKKREEVFKSFDVNSKKEFEKISEELRADGAKFFEEIDEMAKFFNEKNRTSECKKVASYIVEKISQKQADIKLLDKIIKKHCNSL